MLIVIMAVGALVWAYTIGSFCAVLSSLDEHTVAMRQTLDELNTFYQRLQAHAAETGEEVWPLYQRLL